MAGICSRLTQPACRICSGSANDQDWPARLGLFRLPYPFILILYYYEDSVKTVVCRAGGLEPGGDERFRRGQNWHDRFEQSVLQLLEKEGSRSQSPRPGGGNRKGVEKPRGGVEESSRCLAKAGERFERSSRFLRRTRQTQEDGRGK